MYWPIGPAKAYEQHIPLSLVNQSDDGLEPRAQSPGRSKPPVESPTTGISQGRASKSKAHKRHRTQSVNGSAAPNLQDDDGSITSLRVPRNGHVFATITRTTLTVWLTKPAVVLTSVIRSLKSLKIYGHNVGLLIRPDADLLVIQSSLGFLITYSLIIDGDVRAYQLYFADGGRHARRKSTIGPSAKYGLRAKGSLFEGGGEAQEAQLQFQMVIRIDAGISKALALDNELVVITKEPPAVQCIRWSPDRSGAQFSTQMMSDMAWLEGRKTLSEVTYDKPMNLFAFLSDGGRAYAVQRFKDRQSPGQRPNALFDGHIFHVPESDDDIAVKAAINSRFSLVAVGCMDNSICVYAISNYAGGIKMLRRLSLGVSNSTSGSMTNLVYSTDGYHLFAGYERGWATWSVYGQPGGSTFGSDQSRSEANGDLWLCGVLEASWIGGGSELLMTTPQSDLVWCQEFARNAMSGCFTPANVSRGLLQASSSLIVYHGDQMTDLATITADASVWQHVQTPSHYLADQWPIRISVISPEGRYIAIAGHRGLAHYSLTSGRWRTFNDAEEQNEFSVRGGMCWHQHVLIASVETSTGAFEIRLYSRELPLESGKTLHTVGLTSPIVNLSTSGENGVLAYTYENTLDHYIIDVSKKSVKLTKVGQIALHGIIRAPARVRAVSWIVPDHHLLHGEPSQDVTSASVLFLVDGKLVLLQPSATDGGELKYDMRVIASSIEYFMLSRDEPSTFAAIVGDLSDSSSDNSNLGLKDSLWAFDGQSVKIWPDIRDLLGLAATEHGQASDADISIPLDFYPITATLQKGLLIGSEAELMQRRDVNFGYFRTITRATLFLPAVLRYYLAYYDIPVALQLCSHFQSLPYFSHALEILLHTVLDEEVEKPTSTAPPSGNPSTSGTPPYPTSTTPPVEATSPPTSLLPTVLAFLSTFPNHLDIILQCTRKTELRSWRTLFEHLPPPSQIFESTLQAGNLKTAGGYLLLLQQSQDGADLGSPTSPPISASGQGRLGLGLGVHPIASPLVPFGAAGTNAHVFVVSQAVRLLRRAQKATDWELCKELARFLMALDETGDVLRHALEAVERDEENGEDALANGLGLVDLGKGEDDAGDRD